MKQFVIIGCGQFGKSCALKLSELNQEVLVIDKDEDTINEVSKYVTHAVVCDVLTEETMNNLGISNFDVAIIAMSTNFEATIMACVFCKNLGIKRIIAKAKNPLHEEILKKLGVDGCVIPERDSGIRLAKSISSSHIADYIEVSKDYSMVDISPLSKWCNQTLAEVDLRRTHGLNVIAVRNDQGVKINPEPLYRIQPKDVLMVIGESKVIDQIIREVE